MFFGLCTLFNDDIKKDLVDHVMDLTTLVFSYYYALLLCPFTTICTLIKSKKEEKN